MWRRRGALEASARDLARFLGDGLVVDRFDRADHELDAEPLVDELAAGAAKRVGVGMVEEQEGDGPREGVAIVGRDEEPGSTVLDHLGDATDGTRDDGPREGHR